MGTSRHRGDRDSRRSAPLRPERGFRRRRQTAGRISEKLEIFLSSRPTRILTFSATGIILGALLCSCAHPERSERRAGTPTLPFFVETRNFIPTAPGKSRLDVYVRIPLTFFVFVRNQDPQADAPFMARGEVDVEILDSAGRTVARDLLRRQMGSQGGRVAADPNRTLDSEEHTSELQSQFHLVCRLLLEKTKKPPSITHSLDKNKKKKKRYKHQAE